MGSLRRHWVGPAVLWFTKLAVGWYLHHRISYPVVVLSQGRWVSLVVRFITLQWGSHLPCWAHHIPRNSPPSFVASSLVLLAWLPLPGLRLEVFPSKINPHPSMRGGAGEGVGWWGMGMGKQSWW